MLERHQRPPRPPLPPESEVPCGACGEPTLECIETQTDALGWIIGRRKVRACYSCGKVEEVV